MRKAFRAVSLEGGFLMRPRLDLATPPAGLVARPPRRGGPRSPQAARTDALAAAARGIGTVG